jgi:hypothetical protein
MQLLVECCLYTEHFHGISSTEYSPLQPSLGGSSDCKHPFSSDGVSTSLEQTQRVHRYLSVRYDGHLEVTLQGLATRSATPTRKEELKAFPVPGYLAGSHPPQIGSSTSGHSKDYSSPRYLWRQQLYCTLLYSSPDLPSN